MVGAFYGSHLSEIDPFSDPAFCAIGKRGGFHKSGSYAKFPAMDAEPAVLHRFFFIRKTLYPPFYCRQDPVIVFSHKKLYLLSYFYLLGYNSRE
jgi:hypothetical protein